MRTEQILSCLVIVATNLCACAQGTFQNLDFEQANVPAQFATIATTNAFPGWTAYAGGVPQTDVGHDGPLAAAVALADSARPDLVLDGRFSALLVGLALLGAPGSIGQSGAIPAGSESLTFLERGPLAVSFAGHTLPLQVLGNGPNASQIIGADISAYAGQYGQLLFQVTGIGGIYVLDDISFSAAPIPEPGVLTILGLGGLMLSLRRRRRRRIMSRERLRMP